MRICIFGAGAVGSHFAVRLALAGHEVSCVMRGAHLAAVKANGLTLRVGDAEFKAQREGVGRSGRSRPAGCRHQHVEGDRRQCARIRTAAAAARRHRNRVRAERHSLVVRHRPAAKTIRRFPTSPSSIPAAGCGLRSRKSASSAA